MRISQFNHPVKALALAVLLCAQAVSAESLINAGKDRIAVKGYDVVSYFTKGEPTRGTEEHEHVWRDVRWRFSSEQNKSMFASDPAKYAPRYGGFCAGGIALGRRAPIDPEAFVIIDGKLYLNFDKPTADEFGANAQQSIADADANWKEMNRN